MSQIVWGSYTLPPHDATGTQRRLRFAGATQRASDATLHFDYRNKWNEFVVRWTALTADEYNALLDAVNANAVQATNITFPEWNGETFTVLAPGGVQTTVFWSGKNNDTPLYNVTIVFLEAENVISAR